MQSDVDSYINRLLDSITEVNRLDEELKRSDAELVRLMKIQRVGDPEDELTNLFFAPKPQGKLEKEEVGALNKIFGVLLTGERASGTLIYAARKKAFGEIDWIEEKEGGELFKEISPSQALGISTPETKLLSKRGIAALAIDIALDPLTYTGVGLVGKFGKVAKVLIISKKITVGPKGVKYIQEAIARGTSGEAAARELLIKIGSRGQTGYLATKKYTERSVHLFGRPLFYTKPYEIIAKKIWGVLPLAKRRARGVDILKTAFIPFHKIIRDVEEAAKKPFQRFYRGTVAEISLKGGRIEELHKATPKTLNEEVVLALDRGVEPSTPEAIKTSKKLRKIYDEAFEEQVALGMIEREQYREMYMHRSLTKEGRNWMKEHLGSGYKPGLAISEYSKKLGSAEERVLEGGILDINKRMLDKYGVKEFFIEDPYLAAQTFTVQHVKAKYSTLLHRDVIERYGRRLPSDKPAQEITKIDGIEHTLFKYKGDETYLPTVLVDELKRTRPKMGFWTETYDPALGAIKKTWIALWPGFYTRNLYGGVGWQNILAGVRAEDYARNINILYGDPAKIHDLPLYGKKTSAELKELMKSLNVYGQTGYVGEPSSYVTGLSMAGRAYKKYPEQAMHITENQLRGAVFMRYLYQTGDPEYAAEMVYKYHFEYLRGAYTAFEQDVLFRMFPFGPWAVGNIPLQTEALFTQPGKFATLAKAAEMGTTPDEYDRLTDWQKRGIPFVFGNTVVTIDLPVTDLPGSFNMRDVDFMTTPFYKYTTRILSGKDKYGRKLEPLSTSEGAQQHAELLAETFAGRFVYAGKEAKKTFKGERPVSYTAAHQLGGVGVYELKPAVPDYEMFEATMWGTPLPTKEEKYAAWLAAGAPEGFKIKTLVAPPGSIGEAPQPEKKWWEGGLKWHADEQEEEEEKPSFELLALTKEVYEASKGFKPTPTQIRYILTGSKALTPETSRTTARVTRVIDGDTVEVEGGERIRLLGINTPERGEKGFEEAKKRLEELVLGKEVSLISGAVDKGKYGRSLRYISVDGENINQKLLEEGYAEAYSVFGARESRYEELLVEWTAFKAGERQIEQPTEEQKIKSWRFAGKPETYTQKIYRDEAGKLRGVLTYTPEELEELEDWIPTAAQQTWAFRKTTARTITPKKQFELWKVEYDIEQEDKRKLQELRGEYDEWDINAPVERRRYGAHVHFLAQESQTTDERMARKEELEDILAIGVDR